MMLWVVYAKQPSGGPAQVLEYLGRYMHRVAIFNERILGMDSALTGQFVRRFGVGASHKCSPGYPFLLHQLLLSHDIGLTPHFKTLQSPQVPFSYGSVQRGLSAANKAADLTSLGKAADKRYSLGIIWRV